MRLPLLVPALALGLLSGCLAPEPSTPSAELKTWTQIIVDADVLIGPGLPEARFLYKAPGTFASGAIRVVLEGTATSVTLEAPEACDAEVTAPGPTGIAWTVMECGPMLALGDGALVLRASPGTAQGHIVFAVTQVPPQGSAR
jgi:hypothetical protein